MRLQLAHQRGLGSEGFCHNQQATGVFVQPVHDARARNFGQLRRVMQQRIEHRACPVTATGMHHQPGRFVDDQHAVVFKRNIQRNVFCLMQLLGRMRLRRDRDRLAAPHFLLDRGWRTLHGNLLLYHPLLQAAARILWQQPGQYLVEAHPGAITGDFKCERSGRVGLPFQLRCGRLLNLVIIRLNFFGFNHAP